jgi:sterol 3beta-glucosyltransferase
MKIGMVTYGSNGDIEPMVSLAIELANRGHEIELFIISIHDRDYQFLNKYPRITARQKKYTADLRNLPDEDLEFWNQDLNNQFVLMDRWFKSTLDTIIQHTEQLCQRNEVIVSVQHLLEVACIAEKYQRPFVSLRALPAHVRSHKIAPYWLSFFDLQHMSYEQQWDLLESHENKSYKRYINRFRKNYDLPPVKNVMKEVIDSAWLNLISYSEHLHQQQDDWDPTFHLCGHFKAPSYIDWDIPTDLKDFIGDEKPILISLYSMLEYENSKEGIQSLLIEAASLLNRKVIIHSSWQESSLHSPLIYKLSGIISFPRLLPLCSLVVHHGGVGISHLATEFNCPSIIIKYGCDHPYNADALEAAGACKHSLYRKDITAAALASMIKDSAGCALLAQRTEQLSHKIRSEKGVEKAADIFEDTFSTLAASTRDLIYS